MKKVFSTSDEVIHLFAQQTQKEGRNGSSNVFFEGKKLYSYGYHYLLAEFIDDNTVMIKDSGYSVTTSKHIGEADYATRQYRQFYTTKTDVEQVYNTVIANKNKLATARKPELYIQPILSLWASLNEFIEYKKDKLTKKTSEYKEIKRIVKALEGNVEDYTLKLNQLAVKQAKAKKRKDVKDLKEALVKFNSYETRTFRIGNEDFLRLSKDGLKVESSQGVSVKVENAKTLYNMILRGIDIKGKSIEHYTVTSINGTLKIGCHSINIKSMHEVGKQL